MIVWLALAAGILFLALSVYPVELSWFSRNGTRWLYERSAEHYEDKWRRHDYTAYDALISRAATAAGESQALPRVLDLGTGSGRAIQTAARVLGKKASYTGVDFSAAMLAKFRQGTNNTFLSEYEVKLIRSDIGSWLSPQREPFDLILCMEVGEFLPDFKAVVQALGSCSRTNTRLVMTRPAGLWCYFFPGRIQGRSALREALEQEGFCEIKFSPWRGRYELLACRRA